MLGEHVNSNFFPTTCSGGLKPFNDMLIGIYRKVTICIFKALRLPKILDNEYDG
jgi:hypothetical protein